MVPGRLAAAGMLLLLALPVAVADTDRPPIELGWTVSLRTGFGDGPVVILPQPIHNATVAFPNGLEVYMVDGRRGTLANQFSSLSGGERGVLLDVDGDGVRGELLLSSRNQIALLDLLQEGDRWTWYPGTSGLNGLSVIAPDGQIVAVQGNGTVVGIDPRIGITSWSVPGDGNTTLLGEPVVFEDGSGILIAAVLPGRKEDWTEPNASWVTSSLVRLVRPDGTTLWSHPLRTQYTINWVPMVAVGRMLVVFEGDWDFGPMGAVQRVFAVDVDTGRVLWNASWTGFPLFRPPVVVPTAAGPFLTAAETSVRWMRLWPLNGTLDHASSDCGGFDRRPALVDFAGDGFPELVSTTDGNRTVNGMVCVQSVPDLRTTWNQTFASHRFWGDPVVGDVDLDGRPEMVSLAGTGAVGHLNIDAFELNVAGPPPPPDYGFLLPIAAVGVPAAVIVLLMSRPNRRKENGVQPKPSAP